MWLWEAAVGDALEVVPVYQERTGGSARAGDEPPPAEAQMLASVRPAASGASCADEKVAEGKVHQLGPR